MEISRGSITEHHVSCASPSKALQPYETRIPFALKILFFFVVPALLTILCVLWSSIWFNRVAVSCCLSVLCYLLTICLIPFFAANFKDKNHTGRDLNKLDTLSEVPESLGIVCASTFLMACIVLQLSFSEDYISLLEFNAGLLSICSMTLLGFVDDILDLRWRYKLILPMYAGLPLVITYRGTTSILIPKFIQTVFHVPQLLDLGHLYRLFMVLISIFCTNSINIYAGINGLEVGQTVVICASLIIYNTMTLQNVNSTFLPMKFVEPAQHCFSLLISLPFLTSCLGLIAYNWYPSTVFVGDTFTYFAGMYFSVVGILGHFSKGILLLFLPQLLNFILSLPQLFALIPCPRHRVPRISEKTGRLHPSPNLTLINATLWAFGPMTERNLCIFLLCLQEESVPPGELATAIHSEFENCILQEAKTIPLRNSCRFIHFTKYIQSKRMSVTPLCDVNFHKSTASCEYD